MKLGVVFGVLVTLALSICPARKAVGEIGHVTGCSTCSLAQVTAQRDNATVVASGGGVGVTVVDQVLHKAVSGCSSLCAVLHHVEDGLVGVVGVELCASVRLHEAGVGDATVRLGDLDFGASVGLE